MNIEKKRQEFLKREEHNKRQDLKDRKTYYPPTHVQFDVLTYDDLNPQNKEKLRKFLEKARERGLNYTVDDVMGEVRKYDTSVIDHLLRYAFW